MKNVIHPPAIYRTNVHALTSQSRKFFQNENLNFKNRKKNLKFSGPQNELHNYMRLRMLALYAGAVCWRCCLQSNMFAFKRSQASLTGTKAPSTGTKAPSLLLIGSLSAQSAHASWRTCISKRQAWQFAPGDPLDF